MIKREIVDVLNDLPEICVAESLTEPGKYNLLKRGSTGYWPCSLANAATYNERHGITPAQVTAMEIGSMMGFDVPGADPLNH